MAATQVAGFLEPQTAQTRQRQLKLEVGCLAAIQLLLLRLLLALQFSAVVLVVHNLHLPQPQLAVASLAMEALV